MMQEKPLIIGLTGGICSGKSLAANLFHQLGVPIVDADAISQQLTQTKSKNNNIIIEHFGPSIAKDDGSINRPALAQHIFNHAQDKQWLEDLLHPQIRAIMAEQIAQITSPYAICIIPLLAENHPHPLVDRVLVIDAPITLQQQRLQQRDHLSSQQAQQRLNNQASRKERLNIADDIINNDDSKETLQQVIEKQHQHYSKLANNQ